MKRYYFSTLIIALVLAGSAAITTAQTEPYFALISPANGEVLRGGRQVEIQWDLRLDKSITEDPFGEMEFYLQTDEGLYIRITPQLSLSHRKFVWTVPNIRTASARLVAYAGTEGGGDFYRFPQSGTFQIRPTKSAETIILNALPKDASRGEDMRISWTSYNVKEGAVYDVMVSYDRGAHFYKAGSTTDTNFDLPIGDDFAGSITIQIETRSGNLKIKSLQTRDATMTIGDKRDR